MRMPERSMSAAESKTAWVRFSKSAALRFSTRNHKTSEGATSLGSIGFSEQCMARQFPANFL